MRCLWPWPGGARADAPAPSGPAIYYITVHYITLYDILL